MKKIQLTQGKVALVDDEDYELVSLFNWQYHNNNKVERAVSSFRLNDKVFVLYMHRLIMNTPKGMVVDHKYHNGLDNRKKYLRNCTNQQNLMNALSKGGTSQYKGVAWVIKKKKWMASIMINGKNKHIGYFHEEKAAAQAYDIMARKLFGEFAYFNNIGVIS